MPQVTLDLPELIDALYACGERFIALLHRLSSDSPDAAETAAYLEQHAAIARQALSAAGKSGG